LDLEELDSHIVFFHMNLTTLYSCEKDIFRWIQAGQHH
jgi:hypothetical protein